MCHPHLLTILYVNQQSINKVPKVWGQQNEKGNGSSPDFFLVRLRRAIRKKGLACKTSMMLTSVYVSIKKRILEVLSIT